MAIEQREAPTEVIVALQRAIGRRVVGKTFLTQKLSQADPAELSYSTPHRVAFVPIDELQPGNKLRQAARITGWRFLIHEGKKKAIAAARILETEEEEHHLAEITEGPSVSETERAIHQAEDLGLVDNGSFEAVLLTAPEVHVNALWLQSNSGFADIVIPFAPTSPDVKAGTANTPDEFMKTLCDRAARLRPR